MPKKNNPGCKCCPYSSGPGNISGCFCQHIAADLAMTSVHPACNGGLFQSDTLTWQATPPAYATLSIAASGYFGSVLTDGTGATFQYYFTCVPGSFTLTRVYPAQGGSAARLDTVRYSWPTGAPGNTCSPFNLTSGTVFSGGDPTCDVTIAEAP